MTGRPAHRPARAAFDRLREVRAKLVAGRLDGVRLEKSRLKITPYDPLTPPAGERLDRTIDALMPRIRNRSGGMCTPSRGSSSVYRSALRARPRQSGRAPRLDSQGATNLGRERMARASSGVSHAQLSWASVGVCGPKPTPMPWRGHRRPPRPAGRACGAAPAGPRRTGSSLRRSRRNAGEINAKYGPGSGPQDLLLPVRALRLVPFQRDPGHRRRGAVRARRTDGQRRPVRPPRAPCRYRRRVRPRLRPVPPARSLVRTAAARLSGPSAGVLRQTRAVEGTRPPHGQADQRGGRARALERRFAVDGQYQNRVRNALGDAAQARRLPPAEPPVSRSARSGASNARCSCSTGWKAPAPHGVPGGAQQGRGATPSGPCSRMPIRAASTTGLTRPSKNASWRNLVIAAIVYWNTAYIGRPPPTCAVKRRLPDPTLTSARLAVGMGAHGVEPVTRLELRSAAERTQRGR